MTGIVRRLQSEKRRERGSRWNFNLEQRKRTIISWLVFPKSDMLFHLRMFFLWQSHHSPKKKMEFPVLFCVGSLLRCYCLNPSFLPVLRKKESHKRINLLCLITTNFSTIWHPKLNLTYSHVRCTAHHSWDSICPSQSEQISLRRGGCIPVSFIHHLVNGNVSSE